MRKTVLLFASLAASVAVAVACSGSPGDVTAEGAEAGDGVVLLPDGTPAPTGPAGSGLATGLPCDVQAILENRCLACHSGTTPASLRLLDYADLVAPSLGDPTKSMAVAALARMRSTTNPMPPPPAVPPDADEIQTFADWVAAGTPKGQACTDPPPDGGTTPDAGTDADADAGAIKCTSGKTWADGNNGSSEMHPGLACNACHQVSGGPNLRIAGTVYPTAHEPNDCNGSTRPPQLTVVVTDAKKKVVRIALNAAGNFETNQRVSAPFKAVVTDGTKTRAMVGSVTSGDCNSCHTVAGINGSPGRIMAP